MKHIINKLLVPVLGFMLVAMASCEKEYHFGDLTTPAKPVLNITVVGKDATHPNGNGSGNINVNIQSQNGINYKVDFGDGEAPQTSTTSEFSYQYKHTGIKTVTVSVTVYGKGGVSSTNSETITVYREFEPNPELVTMLTNNGAKKWRVDKDASAHLGVGDAASMVPGWWGAGPNEKAGLGIYDDVYTFTAQGNVFEHTTNNDLFGKKEYLKDFDPSLTGTGDFTLTGPTAASYTTTFSYDGSATEEFIIFSGKGHLGMYLGAHKFQILERSATHMTLRCVQDPGAWYVKIIAIE
ncbi:hypothetical protein SAMN05660909_05312 [Chitinophaga terrae (ex Kim and Jung 2007)]|uniref:PKD domain-containing protein n=1 Tax=Chitinophaga terrae (ex Kim and Jung 2007) TaxID=408074 RepID=A0A1H4GG29_9BACT|nr:PKD domain-containing protein [Chitinophaga terrae (ex Kim and Jung 2007)]MDQ0110071.1 hypothetical protein [Chitinophaga terrae (ex Kim and Jung 2007)]GEP93427.1 hypothetical protein CTE07_50720 [Chitinophaga terrae (ex Kim and Jung 2007)]SEB08556.1 hypothetical protein SAMN05660909_05312 [Chitinophaga terrae (ex Kim and Jung 2007)]